MKRSVATSLISLALSVPASALAASWEIDGAHTTSAFEVTHMTLTTVRGQFQKTTGTVEIDDKDVTRSKLDIVIDASSVDTRNADRDKHLRTADFFDVANHPNITFKSTKVEKAGKDKLKVTGDLTMRGVSKPVVLDVTYTGQEVKTPWGFSVRSARATGKINRKDWNILWNKTLDGGGFVVSDEVQLIIDAELKPAAPAATTN